MKIRSFGWKSWLIGARCVGRALHVEDMNADPFAQFESWQATAVKAALPEPTAMSLATVGADGFPSQRMVLMKRMSAERGVFFYTNYESRKAKELEAHPQAALLFHYHILQRQIRFEGTVERASREESEAYFRSRPRDSQLGAWASLQSSVLPDRSTFEERFKEVEARFEGKDVTCPEFWGGYRLVPRSIEFWQGRAFRLHDRFVYERQSDGSWAITRLYP